MNLLQDAADPGLVAPNDHEQVFHDKTHLGQLVYELDMRQPLLIGANFILAFDNVSSLIFQHPVGLAGRFEVEV
jgi:predicted ATP-dependent Lon-type protease